MRRRYFLAALGLCGGMSGACNRVNFPDDLPANATQVTAITSQSGVDSQDKRDELTALGFDDLTINALLQSDRLGNQFGGTLRTAYDKVVGKEYNQLTPDEVQRYADATAKATIADAEAQAIVTFFQDNNITSSDDLKTYLADAANDVPTIINRDNLKAIFVDFDPNDIIDKLP